MYLGVDVGSVSTDAVLIDDECNIVGYSIVKSGFDHKAAAAASMQNVCTDTKIPRSEISVIVGTGYGRKNVPDADTTVTEISCHAMGVHVLFPSAGMVIDIGGQDCKAVHISDDGFVETFVMNDKCAAGTGRFLEIMALAMGVDVCDLGQLSLKAEKVQSISSICTVFAESEVISKIAEGCAREEIVAGIHRAIGERIMGMVASIGIKSPVALSGGVVKNAGVVDVISRHLDQKCCIPAEPQIIGALGAAVYAKNYEKPKHEKLHSDAEGKKVDSGKTS